jgi:hypothetical protein
MTDEELVKRLHQIACHKAADRIEALIKERDDAVDQVKSLAAWLSVETATVADLEITLKRQSIALKEAINALQWYDDPSSQGDVARAFLDKYREQK